MFGEQFYPTPEAVALKMLKRISHSARIFLEPSAGKGDLIDFVRERRSGGQFDCVAIDPDLVNVLIGRNFTVVGHDWLEYDGISYYDAILMNPPFANGVDHLLKAWDFLFDGEIVCLLNAETLRNPYTAARRRLAAIIAEHGDTTDLGSCFADAERRADVDVVMVYLRKIGPDETTADLWSNRGAETGLAGVGMAPDDQGAIALRDHLGSMQTWYDGANRHMIEAMRHIRLASQYMRANGVHSPKLLEQALPLAASNVNHARAEFIRAHRRAAWGAVFEQTGFRKWLDEKQRDAFMRDVERGGHFPFTKANIQGTLENVFLQRRQLFEQSVANVFDRLTRYFKGNTNHTEGWKSNDGYKVNMKLVFPNGCKFETPLEYFICYDRAEIYEDLDRILCVLGGRDFAHCLTVRRALEASFNVSPRSQPKACESDHFRLRYFKKGTVHLVFRDRNLWQAFNVTAAAGKAWIGQDRRAA